jgi:hypothetical protein
MCTVVGKALHKFAFLLTTQKSKYFRNNMKVSNIVQHVRLNQHELKFEESKIY